jgi:hypothetical protein
MPSGDVRIETTLNKVNYTISYELNGGTNDANNPATYNVESENITLADPTRAGYTFL